MTRPRLTAARAAFAPQTALRLIESTDDWIILACARARGWPTHAIGIK
jgi:hypothetical protein